MTRIVGHGGPCTHSSFRGIKISPTLFPYSPTAHTFSECSTLVLLLHPLEPQCPPPFLPSAASHSALSPLQPPGSLQILLAGTVPQEGPSQEAAAKVTCSWWVSGPQYILPPGSWNRPGHHLGSKLSNPSGTSLPFSCFSPLCSSTQAFLSLLFSLAS